MLGDKKTEVTKKQKNKKNKKITISFDDDFASNHEVQKIIDSCKDTQPKKQNKAPQIYNPEDHDNTREINNESQGNVSHNNIETIKKKRKRNKKSENHNAPEEKAKTEPGAVENDTQFELNPVKPQIEGEESIRQRKRKRYLQLLEENKLKSELKLQQGCLNYLSQWKHSRSTWKFEKLKQIWILQHMYDNTRIPDEVWMIVVEYFSNAMGKIKSTIISEALKIVESNSKNGGDEDTEVDVKYDRARFIVQNLQE